MNYTTLPEPDRQRLVAHLQQDTLEVMKRYAYVKGFEGKPVRFDPQALDPLQAKGIKMFLGAEEELLPDGRTPWVVELKYRQAGRSTGYEVAALAKMMYAPEYDHLCIADLESRAKYLHGRIHYTYRRWDETLRTPRISAKEVNQMTLDPMFGGRGRVLSAASFAAGIGQSPDGLHGSEVGFWGREAVTAWAELYPALANRPRANVVLECAPTRVGSFWHGMWLSAKAREGRYRPLFTPFYVAHHNRRAWPDGAAMDLEELRLLDRYSSLGLTKEHLSFRRETIQSVQLLRKNPELFTRYYPFDDISCWQSGESTAIPSSVLARHNSSLLVPWRGSLMVYEEPKPGLIYAIGVDPAGYGVRDHAVAQVFCMNLGEVRQVACLADRYADPQQFARTVADLGLRYGKALIVPEGNGVGAGFCTALLMLEYPNVYYYAAGKPGWNNNRKSYQEIAPHFLESLDTTWRPLRDEQTLEQLQTYRNDKMAEASAREEVIAQMNYRRYGQRRERHHWDKVTALFGIVVAQRSRRWPTRPGGNPALEREEAAAHSARPREKWSWDDRRAAEAEAAAVQKTIDNEPRRRRRRRVATTAKRIRRGKRRAR